MANQPNRICMSCRAFLISDGDDVGAHGVKCKICRKWNLPGDGSDMVSHGIKRIETYHRKCQNEHSYKMRVNRRNNERTTV